MQKRELKKNWIENISGWSGLSYVVLLGMPMKRSKDSGVPDMPDDKINKLIAQKIIQSQVPIKGRELQILRAATRLSLNSFANKIGVTYGAVYYWEKNIKKRLQPFQEVAIRLLCAEELNFEASNKYSELVGNEYFEKLEVQITNKAPTSKFIKFKTVLKPSYRGFRKVQVVDND